MGGPLYPGTGSDTIQATVQNATGAPLALNQLEVSITGVTMNPPGSLYATAGDPACTTADYALSAPTSGPGSFWTGLTVNGGTKTGQSATWTQNLPQNVGVDDYVVNGLPGGSGVAQALPAGLTLDHAQQHGEPGRLPGRVRPGDYFGELIQSSEVVNGRVRRFTSVPVGTAGSRDQWFRDPAHRWDARVGQRGWRGECFRTPRWSVR